MAFVIQHLKTNAISVLSLTSEYTFSIVPRARGQRVGPTIQVLANERYLDSGVQLSVDSLTVVYGENGEGKTTLLLDVCRTLTPYGRERPLGTIWRDESGVVRLDPGVRQEALRLSGPLTADETTRPKERFGTVFYTTSPFESARRRGLAFGRTIDVTPSFGTNSFNGTSLCQAAGSLPKDIPFIRRARVQLEISEHLDIDEEIEKFASTLFPADIAEATSSRKSRLSKEIDRLKEFASGLSPRTSSLLAIELHRTRLDGPKAAEFFLLEIDRNEEPPGSKNVAVVRFLRNRGERSRGLITAPHILKAMEQLKKAAAAEMPKELLAYSRLLRSLSPMVIAGLQEAENLGLLRWNFLELSSGQVALLMLFASLSAALETLRKKGTRSIVLVVDEGEMFMHPAWQRKYLRDLLKFIEHYRASFGEIHLILATHSLIVAGDAPPNRLFDVKSGEMRNGFAYGPKEILTDVYGVDEFSGNMAEALYEKIVAFLRTTAPLIEREKEVEGLIEQIASPQLRTYLLGELQRRRQHRHA
ncbi:AAA family ATPase [Comamonas odontotermitis]|uniref:AAA family ATPase n=1 Tax=Comamonas odontotermitis TaxID=379895 RepID=UPI003750DDB0